MGFIPTDLTELPPRRRRSYLDPLLGGEEEFRELVRGSELWPAHLDADGIRKQLSQWAQSRGLNVETTRFRRGRGGLEESPQKLWVKVTAKD